MVSSRTLKNFVKMHEYKLNAKINQRRAGRSDSMLNETHWGADCLNDRHQSQAAEHWQTVKSTNKTVSEPSRRRPQSRYFNFILTATH